MRIRALAATAFAVLALSPTAALAYDGSAAANYADQYWSTYNPSYPSFANKGGDCTNFASQAMHAGGIAFRTTGTGNALWYILQNRKQWSYTTSWVNAQSNSIFISQYLPGVTQVASVLGASPTQTVPSNAVPGDIVFYDWDNNGTFDHEAIVVGADGQSVDAHTNNRNHAYWTLAAYNSQWMTTRIVVYHIPSTTT